MICEFLVVKLAYASLNNVFSSFVVFLLFEGCLVGFWGPLQVHDYRELVSSLLVVLYLCGKTFYIIRVCSLLFSPTSFAWHDFWLMFLVSLY